MRHARSRASRNTRKRVKPLIPSPRVLDYGNLRAQNSSQRSECPPKPKRNVPIRREPNLPRNPPPHEAEQHKRCPRSGLGGYRASEILRERLNITSSRSTAGRAALNFLSTQLNR